MSRRAVATSTWPVASSAAQAVLDVGGTAVDALVAGFFAAAGADAGVLLASAVALVSGTGAGARVFDGRALQPGRGAPRPRGYELDAEIPPAACAAVPRAVAMLLLLHAHHGKTSLRELAREGVTQAEAVGATTRSTLLRKIGASGGTALRADAIARALVAAAGLASGGALTADDLLDARPENFAAVDHVSALSRAVLVPATFQDGAVLGAKTAVVVACDGFGLLAALAVEPIDEGFEVGALELRLPARAEPVRRGITRVPPGEPRAMAAPIAIVHGAADTSLVLGLPGAAALDALDFDPAFVGAAAESAVAGLRRAARAKHAVAVVRDARDARVVG